MTLTQEARPVQGPLPPPVVNGYPSDHDNAHVLLAEEMAMLEESFQNGTLPIDWLTDEAADVVPNEPVFDDATPDEAPLIDEPLAGIPAAAYTNRIDAIYDALAAMTDELIGLERERSALEARRASILARGHQWAARHADELVSSAESRAKRRELAHREVVAEFATAIRVSERTFQAQVDRAVTLVAHPLVHAALSSGALGGGHVAVILDEVTALEPDVVTAGGGTPPTPEAVAEFESRLIERARQATPGDVRRSARRWREQVLPDALDIRHERANTLRRFVIEPVDDAMSYIHALVRSDLASRIHCELTAEAIRARDEIGDLRTIDQLRADLFVERLLGETRAAGKVSRRTPGRGSAFGVDETSDADDDAIRVLPSLRVLVTVPALTLAGISNEPGQLDGVGPIPPALARELVARAPSLTRILTDPITGEALDVGRKSYTIPKALRDWLILRDATCRFPGCSRRAVACDVDHSIPWIYGGTTTCGNLAHLCRKHHRMKGLTDWHVEQLSESSGERQGTLRWTSPTGRVYVTHPPEWPPGARDTELMRGLIERARAFSN